MDPATIEMIIKAAGIPGAVVIFLVYSHMQDRKQAPKTEDEWRKDMEEWRREVGEWKAQIGVKMDVLWMQGRK